MEIDKVSEIVWKQCLSAKKNEKAIIVFDKKTEEIADSLFRTSPCEVSRAETRKSKMHGEEPEKSVAEEMFSSDIVIAPTTYSLTHTKATYRARKQGKARVITMPGITKDMYIRAVPVDYEEMNRHAKEILKYWKGKDALRIETKAGTDLYIEIKDRKTDIDSGLCLEKGNLCNLPAGEVEVPPLEGKSEGKVVVDLTHPLKGMVRKPFVIKINNGKMVDCTDKELWKICSETDNGTNLAEFAVGTNPKARITGIVLEDEKVRKTAHVAFGTNKSLGGKIQSSIHLDCVFKKPEIR